MAGSLKKIQQTGNQLGFGNLSTQCFPRDHHEVRHGQTEFLQTKQVSGFAANGDAGCFVGFGIGNEIHQWNSNFEIIGPAPSVRYIAIVQSADAYSTIFESFAVPAFQNHIAGSAQSRNTIPKTVSTTCP